MFKEEITELSEAYENYLVCSKKEFDSKNETIRARQRLRMAEEALSIKKAQVFEDIERR